MKLTVLGCWAPYPRVSGACSGYLLQENNRNLLLDAGNGVLSRLLQHIDIQELDAVLLSHLHPDHLMDIYALRHAIEAAIREGRMDKPIPLYLPNGPAEDFDRITGFTNAFVINVIDRLPEPREVHVAGCRVKFVPAKHNLPAYSMLLEGSKRFVYSGDTAYQEELIKLAAGADLFLCEASGLDSDMNYLQENHLTARQAGELARAAGAKRLVITHFYPEYVLSLLQRQAAEGFGRQVELAREGATLEV
ncbi:MBL fold metallo-hydrolase [Desulforamulus hydrothermalis]|uniref:Beta-lactamase domain protein n=1 Tax=Desulforamulus hydrothermalis Lam5 = DSM 18033 TaxID=1121428 RepID=K8EH47_9FIRM|nr:MBL fold metallo-hydrolase [Desulforamulus hydrothermalis]CCO07951.1 Beta-lactamase domain protein [Desulforamulus hydrothermalis Lam5 = DSM 18033]SHG85531.1 Ribonuclease BN, tRNA processing enzyme [Desulforamulus hydrothermalis Lam5 = DSM 18033]